jgi:hypothetical protein
MVMVTYSQFVSWPGMKCPGSSVGSIPIAVVAAFLGFAPLFDAGRVQVKIPFPLPVRRFDQRDELAQPDVFGLGQADRRRRGVRACGFVRAASCQGQPGESEHGEQPEQAAGHRSTLRFDHPPERGQRDSECPCERSDARPGRVRRARLQAGQGADGEVGTHSALSLREARTQGGVGAIEHPAHLA